jgi:hypothetical protein
LRYDRIDAFWDTLPHECAHVKYDDGSSVAKPEAELKSDEFASSFSIPGSELDGFIARGRRLLSKTRI